MSPARDRTPPPRREVAWPPLGSRALLTAPGEEPRATVVEDVDGDAVAVAVPPLRKGELEPPREGDPFELSWPGPRGLVVVPVLLRARVRDGVPLWWLQVAGGPDVKQRRSFVRSEAVLPFPARVVVDWQLPERGSAAGELQDLSEGGLRAHLRATGPGADCPEGAGVAVRLTLVDVAHGAADAVEGVDVTEHELFGTVLRSGRLLEDPDACEVVVQLHDDRAQADALRRLVFAWQRRARRS
ncbi:PilZ domain-containing protein [Streptomyces sp. NP160]|uniref:PilZ domain-containing protein n=1 Tax=Streptomyces sp. NP160 TaxID=2586637 RepID=UPI00111B7893|nr:PilZ domain-containing protein [Streptomyces sp. NP160]TNM69407.1 PilZ domain-containing protein [Streptomyces sp. NP160]